MEQIKTYKEALDFIKANRKRADKGSRVTLLIAEAIYQAFDEETIAARGFESLCEELRSAYEMAEDIDLNERAMSAYDKIHYWGRFVNNSQAFDQMWDDPYCEGLDEETYAQVLADYKKDKLSLTEGEINVIETEMDVEAMNEED